MSDLALIAGRGRLPAELVAALRSGGLEAPLVCAPEGLAPERLAVGIAFRFERLAPFLSELGDRGITRVVLAGAMDRPRLDPALCDPLTASLMPRLLGAMAQGDDGTLRALIALIGDFGLEVVGATTLAPQLLAPEGLIAGRAPRHSEEEDAARGGAILAITGPADVGQGCVVASGLCLGLEALYGTDALLADVAARRASREPQRGGVLVKRAKPGQELRVDVPAIGPETLEGAARAGLGGICLQAGAVVVLDRAGLAARARELDMAIWAVS